MVSCPECGTAVRTPASPERGQFLDCPACGAELEAVRTDPLTIEPAPQVELDWGE